VNPVGIMRGMTEKAAPSAAATASWLVYIIEASDGSLYTGITTDMQRRWQQHSAGLGARFFRGRSPRTLVFVEAGHDRGSASRREAAIKKLSRAAKLALIAAVATVSVAKETAGIWSDAGGKGLRPE